jgi:hypothetical protein
MVSTRPVIGLIPAHLQSHQVHDLATLNWIEDQARLLRRQAEELADALAKFRPVARPFQPGAAAWGQAFGKHSLRDSHDAGSHNLRNMVRGAWLFAVQLTLVPCMTCMYASGSASTAHGGRPLPRAL